MSLKTPNMGNAGLHGQVPENSGRPMRSLTRLIDLVWGSLPLILFLLAIALASFGYGGLVAKYRLFPYSFIADGVKTGGTAAASSSSSYARTADVWRWSTLPPER